MYLAKGIWWENVHTGQVRAFTKMWWGAVASRFLVLKSEFNSWRFTDLTHAGFQMNASLWWGRWLLLLCPARRRNTLMISQVLQSQLFLFSVFLGGHDFISDSSLFHNHVRTRPSIFAAEAISCWTSAHLKKNYFGLVAQKQSQYGSTHVSEYSIGYSIWLLVKPIYFFTITYTTTFLIVESSPQITYFWQLW